MLDGEEKFILKEDAVPTIFEHRKPQKRRASSIKRTEEKVKKRMVEEAFQEYEAKQKEQSKNADKSLDTSDLQKIKTKSIRTQYNTKHFSSSSCQEDETSKTLKVKLPAKKKQKHVLVNTELSFGPFEEVLMSVKSNEMEMSDPETDIEIDDEKNDPDFKPSNSSENSESSDEEESLEERVEVSKLEAETSFLVYWACLLPLLKFCLKCNATAVIKKTFIKGTMLGVNLFCSNNHETTWHSQPLIRGTGMGNVALAAGTLFSGGTFQRINDIFQISKIACFSRTTFNKFQKKFLFPSIQKVFIKNRTLLIDEAKKQKNGLDLLGDGRCDSPGYSAKYGTYTIMDSLSGYILDFHVSHSKMAGNSQRMELNGLKEVLRRLETLGIAIASLTTDRHTQVRKFMRTIKDYIKHQFDVWHMGKNIKKKLTKAAKRKSCAELNAWIKSIINHFWWCCSSCKGNPEELKEKWLSILQHIANKHTWKGCKIYKKCAHKKLSKKERRHKPFLKTGSPAHKALSAIVQDKGLISDLKYLTQFSHTGTLEVYHSLYNKYCPKRLHFSYNGMIARSQLAVLDFNSGVGLAQAKTKKGTLRFKQQHSKVTQSWVMKKVTESKERRYLDELMLTVKSHVKGIEKQPLPKLQNVPKNIAPTEKPDKEEAILNMRSRFLS